MTFQHTCISDTCELGIVQCHDVCGATVAHARAQTTYQLVDNLLHCSLVGHSSCNTFGHQLLHLCGVALEVAVFLTVLLLHSFQRTHATIALELTSVEDDGFAGALFSAGHQ